MGIPTNVIRIHPDFIVHETRVGNYVTLECYDDDALILRTSKIKGGITLGRFIILNKHIYRKDCIRHQYGHRKQSLWLGPLYLFVIIIPSAIHHFWYNHKYGKLASYKRPCYHTSIPDKWADKIVGIKRNYKRK